MVQSHLSVTPLLLSCGEAALWWKETVWRNGAYHIMTRKQKEQGEKGPPKWPPLPPTGPQWQSQSPHGEINLNDRTQQLGMKPPPNEPFGEHVDTSFDRALLHLIRLKTVPPTHSGSAQPKLKLENPWPTDFFSLAMNFPEDSNPHWRPTCLNYLGHD